jgi:molecular chaperone GrpE
MSENADRIQNEAAGEDSTIADVAVEGAELEGADEETLSLAEIEELRAKAAKADEHWDRLLRTQADLENYRKRALRERQEAIQSAQATLLGRILPALDSFEMAMAATQAGEGQNLESLRTGLDLAYGQLRTALSEAGLEEIDAAERVFDPNVHEALSQQESAVVPEGHVLHQVRKGYRLKERLIRPASVIVAKKPGA